MEDLTNNVKVRTVSDLMVSLEDEIAAIKDGTLKDSTARLVLRGRAIQMQAVGMYLQAARIEASLRPALGRRMGIVDVKPAAIEPGKPLE